jgi:hypothetical protein
MHQFTRAIAWYHTFSKGGLLDLLKEVPIQLLIVLKVAINEQFAKELPDVGVGGFLLESQIEHVVEECHEFLP